MVMRRLNQCLIAFVCAPLLHHTDGFAIRSHRRPLYNHMRFSRTCQHKASRICASVEPSESHVADTSSSPSPRLTVQEATKLLSEWDRYYNTASAASSPPSSEDENVKRQRSRLPAAVRLLGLSAEQEREQDSTKGRCMLGICASSAEEGVAALKSWTTSLDLPRGLLHGMDKDGVPLELDGGVYIKYNTGGSLTFADIRKSGIGFDALWKPGDALLEPYDGDYRGVYFQVELADGEFRQFLVPLDIFGLP